MESKTVTTTPRKVVRWHEDYVIFLTKECKELMWDTKTVYMLVLILFNKNKKYDIICHFYTKSSDYPSFYFVAYPHFCLHTERAYRICFWGNNHYNYRDKHIRRV